MSFGVGTMTDYASHGDASSWQGAPMDGVDLVGEAGIQVGSGKWHAKMSTDLWSVIIIFGSIAALWILGGIVFRNVVIP
jgi:hypothetical protein